VVHAIAVDDELAVAHHVVDLHRLEEELRVPVGLFHVRAQLRLHSGPLHEDAEVLRGEHDALLEVDEHPGVQLVHVHRRVAVAGEPAHPAEVVDMGVADHDVLDGAEGHRLAEALPHLRHAGLEAGVGVGQPRAHVEEGDVVAIEDQIDVVHVAGEGLHRHLVDAHTPPRLEARDVHGAYRITRSGRITRTRAGLILARRPLAAGR
jgi:hypothetical protein